MTLLRTCKPRFLTQLSAGSPRARPPARLPAWRARQQALDRKPPCSRVPAMAQEHGGRSVPMRISSSGPQCIALAGTMLVALPQPAHALSLQDVVSGVQDVVAQAGALGPLVFILAYVAATVLLVPASLLTLAAGALFGPVLGTAVVSAASTTGAACAFLVGRYLARPAVEQRIRRNPKFAAFDAAIAAQGPRIVLLLRLSPLFPFGLLNYGLSLTAVEFWPYVGASWLGMLPGTVAYVGLGGAAAAAAKSAAGDGTSPVQLGLYIVGAAATLAVTKVISDAASKALAEAEGGSGGGNDVSRPTED